MYLFVIRLRIIQDQKYALCLEREMHKVKKSKLRFIILYFYYSK